MAIVTQNLEAMPVIYKGCLQDAIKKVCNKYREEYEQSQNFTRKRKLTIVLIDALVSPFLCKLNLHEKTLGVFHPQTPGILVRS